MNTDKVWEYRKTLTPLQSRAFYKLLEKKFEDSGFYAKNRETNHQITLLQKGAIQANNIEFQNLQTDYEARRDEVEQQIKELNAKRDEIWNTYSKDKEELYAKTYLTIEGEIEKVRATRGDSKTEREIIENLAIAEFQRKLEKKAKQEA